MGVQWDDQHDVFIYDLKGTFDQAKDLSPTKRNILKTLAPFFDPLGRLQPIVLHFKLLFQKLCKMKLNWDTETPSDFIKERNDLLKNLIDLDSIEVNRNVFDNYGNDPIVKRELHGFSDAIYVNMEPQFMLKLFWNLGNFIPISL